MALYKNRKNKATKMRIDKSYEGETIEQKIRRIVNNKEPIKDGAPIVYTDRAEGVRPEYDIRTDRFEIAVDAMDTVTKTDVAKREQRIGERTYDTMNDEQKKNFHEKYPESKIKPINKESGA